MKKIILILQLLILVAPMSGQVVINEYSASNLTGYTDNYQKAEDWIEIYNTGNQNINLGGYYISDDITNPTKWVIPPITIIPGNGYRTFWCSGRDESFFSDIHTNFKLQQTKDTPECIVFSDPEGNIINEIEIQKTQLEHSMGRSSDGSTTWEIFTNPTRGDANTGSSYSAYAGTPAMSIDAGFYNGTQILDISTTEPISEIHYTLNGNVPYSGSTEYSGPLSISNTKVVKAIVISDDTNILPSFITFNTYFIDESHSLPVLSTSANQLLTLLNGSQSLKPHGTIEYFDGDGIRKDFGYGEYNKHGQDSWAFPQRSFDYIARDEMGYHDAIHEKLLSLSDREDFQRIIIRASGDDNYPGIDSSAHMRDIFIQKLANKNKLNVDMRRGERCVVYANGQFWGIYSIREKVSDADYTDFYYGQDKYNTQYLMNWGITWAQYGGEQAFIDWNEIHSFALNNDLSIQANYEYVANEIDVTSLVDYILINSFVVCTDWINWNTSWWRGLDPDGSHQKWGYVLWDEDATFNHYINYTNIPNEHADAEPCYPEDIYLDPEQHIVLLNNLLENDEFRQYYNSRYMDLLNTAFQEDELIEVLEGIENSIRPEMPQHIDRWGGNMAQWRGNVQKIKTFISDRIDYLPEGLNACYNLTGPYDVTLGVEPANGGQIKFNSLTIANEEYPWTGSYHGGTNMLMEAVQNSTPFNHWELINHTLPNPNLINTSLMLTQGDNITAIFTTDETSYIVINEINYNSSVDFDPEDWVELYNLTDDPIDIGNWIFKDENDDHVFTIPDNTSLASDQYVVLCKDGDAFSALFPEANNFVGDLGFGLAGGGELIRLFDSNGILMDIVEYDDSAPWPVEPDGNGPTLELINSSSDNAIGGNWAASAGFGSPGILNTVSGGQENFVINYSENWNLVGLPAIPSDPNYLSLFPDAVEGTLYYYEQSYMNGSDLTSGRGYWLRFNTAGTADITGTPINEISISLLEGWNLISGISTPLSVNNIDDPNGVIISGTFYSFNEGYVQIQELLPGEGYWMRTTEDGVITLSSGSRAKESVQDIRIDDEANTLVINGSKLYFGIELSETEKLQYSLPPVPPDGAFDARFKGDWSIVNDYGEIKIMNPNEMLTVDYKLRNPAEEDGVWVLTSESGAEYLLNSDGEFKVPSEERFTLEKRTDIPMEFALSQNYPNPFNPVTTIRIAIEKYSRVSLKIFDITGRMVTTLIEKELDTGYHNVYWSGKDKMGRSVSSGIYLYRMTARPKDEGKDGGFTRTKKMVLLK